MVKHLCDRDIFLRYHGIALCFRYIVFASLTKKIPSFLGTVEKFVKESHIFETKFLILVTLLAWKKQHFSIKRKIICALGKCNSLKM